MPDLDPSSLPLVQRLALTYAPAAIRRDTLALMLLDNRLAAVLRMGGETMIAQIKLAWWRDRLGEDPQGWPAGEPLLEMLATGSVAPSAYLPLVNGWETLLSEELPVAGIREFADGRGKAWAALASAHGIVATGAVGQAARQWAMADLALNLGTEGEAGQARSLALEPAGEPRLPRAMRPLAVLRGLTLRALRRDSHDVLDGPGAGLSALRIGLVGR